MVVVATVFLLTACASLGGLEARRAAALAELGQRRVELAELCQAVPASRARERCLVQNRKTFAAFGFHVGAATDRSSLDRAIDVIDRCTARESRTIDQTGLLGLEGFLRSINGCVNATFAAR